MGKTKAIACELWGRFRAIDLWAVVAMLVTEGLLFFDWLPMVGMQTDAWAASERWLLVVGTGFVVHVIRSHLRLGREASAERLARQVVILGIRLSRGRALLFRPVRTEPEFQEWSRDEHIWNRRIRDLVRDFYGPAESAMLLPTRSELARRHEECQPLANSAFNANHGNRIVLVDAMCSRLELLLQAKRRP